MDKEEAATRFKNRILAVTGVVSRIAVKYDYDIYYVSLTNSQKREERNVNCMFRKKNGSDLNRSANLTINTAISMIIETRANTIMSSSTSSLDETEYSMNQEKGCLVTCQSGSVGHHN